MRAWRRALEWSKAGRGVVGRRRLVAIFLSALVVFCGLAGALLTSSSAALTSPDGAFAPGPSVRFVDQTLPPDKAEVASKHLSWDPSGVIVEFAPGLDAVAMNSATAGAGGIMAQATDAVQGSARFALVKSASMSAEGLLQKMKNAPGVVGASLNYVRRISGAPNDPLFSQLWGLNNTGQTGGVAGADISVLKAWEATTGNPNVVVVDLDTGVDYTHPDLVGAMWHNPGEISGDGIDNDGNGYVDDVYGIDQWMYDSDPMDENGHGTHTSGTIAAVGNNGIGVVGVATGVKIMALRFLSDWGEGFDFDAITCIEYAIDMKLHHGVNVVAINASWGGDFYSQPLKDAIDAAGQAGIVFCAAAGNWGEDNDYYGGYPASFDCPNIISVAATDHNDDLAWFSNFGATSVDLAAPGVDIVSTIPGFANYVPGAGGDILFDDMEAGGANWTPDPGSRWARTTEAAFSGSYSWTDSPGGKYANNLDASLTSRVIDLSSAPTGTRIGFQLRLDLATDGDVLCVDLSNDGGSTWSVWGWIWGQGTDWTPFEAPLPAEFLTGQFRVRFRLSTDSSGTADGVHLDDVGIGTGVPGYISWDGTSMATPHVAGVVALLASASPNDSVSARVNRVLAATDPKPSLAGKCVTGGRLNAAGALATRYYEQTASTLVWTGLWSSVADPACSGGSSMRAKTRGAAVTATFNGTGVSYLARTGPDQGPARITLDGKVAGVANLFSSTTKYQQVVWRTSGLAPGNHTLKIEFLGNFVMTGTINVDSLCVVGVLTGRQPAITRLSPARGSVDGGTAVAITGAGFADVTGVTFDGVPASSFAVVSPSQITAVAPAHSAGPARVQVTTQWGATSDTGADDFTYALLPTRCEETDPNLVYQGRWTSSSDSRLSAGKYRWVNALRASVTIAFNGTAIDYIATMSSNQGLAHITLDGVDQGTWSLYSRSTKYKQKVWSVDGLSSTRSHSLVIEWTGLAGTGGGTTINLDALDVMGTLIPVT